MKKSDVYPRLGLIPLLISISLFHYIHIFYRSKTDQKMKLLHLGVLRVYGINCSSMTWVQGTCGNGSDLYQDYFRITVLLTNIGPQNMVMFIVQIHHFFERFALN